MQPQDSPSLAAPDNKGGVFVRDYNLWLRSIDGTEKQVTVDGVEHYAYGAWDETFQDIDYGVRRRAGAAQQPQWVRWSPDSRYIVAMRVDLRNATQRPVLTEFCLRSG